MEDDNLFEMKLPNGVGEQMLAHCYQKFDIKLKQTDYGPKLQGSKEELEKAQQFLYDLIEKRLKELEE